MQLAMKPSYEPESCPGQQEMQVCLDKTDGNSWQALDVPHLSVRRINLKVPA